MLLLCFLHIKLLKLSFLISKVFHLLINIVTIVSLLCNYFIFLDVPPKKPPVATNQMVMNTTKTNPPISSKPTPVVSTAPSLPTTNGNIPSNNYIKIILEILYSIVLD